MLRIHQPKVANVLGTHRIPRKSGAAHINAQRSAPKIPGIPGNAREPQCKRPFEHTVLKPAGGNVVEKFAPQILIENSKFLSRKTPAPNPWTQDPREKTLASKEPADFFGMWAPQRTPKNQMALENFSREPQTTFSLFICFFSPNFQQNHETRMNVCYSVRKMYTSNHQRSFAELFGPNFSLKTTWVPPVPPRPPLLPFNSFAACAAACTTSSAGLARPAAVRPTTGLSHAKIYCIQRQYSIRCPLTP